MMQQVPKGKTVYFGARKFIENDFLPPHVPVKFPEEIIVVSEPQKKRGRPRKKSSRSRNNAVLNYGDE
jgi:hypothetical protein